MIFIGGLLLGIVVGGIIGLYASARYVTKRKYISIAQQTQHLLYAYLAHDDVYRTKFIRFSKTEPGMRYVEAILNNVAGIVFRLPLEDSKEIESIIRSYGGDE